MKKLLSLLMLLIFAGVGNVWADTETTLVDFNFTNNDKFPTSTEFANNGETKMTVDNHDIYFYHNNPNRTSFSLSSSGLTFGDNNMSSNYFVAIPLTGIKGEITVTFTHEYSSNKASYRYNIVDGAESYEVSGGNATTSVSDANSTDVIIEKTFQVNSENAVFYFGRNGSNYTRIKGIKITTPKTASKPKLTTFDFNNDDILYYYNTTGNTSAGRSAATSVSTTFEKNADYGANGYLRVKVNIEPDFSTLTNPTFSISSTNGNVLSTEGVTAYYKASNNRMYIDGVKVVGTGSATLTVNFTGSDNYQGGATTTSNTITVIAATAPTLSLTIPTSTTNAEIGSVIELTANKAFSLVEGQYTTRDGINYIAGTINGNTRDFAVDLTKHTLTYTNVSGETLVTFAPNTLYEIVIPAGKISSSGLPNTQQTLSFTTAAPDALTPVNEKLWDFEEADGFPASQIAETAIIDNMELVANSDRKMNFDDTAKSYTEGGDTYNFTRQLKFSGTGAGDGAYRVIHFKVAAGSTVNVFGSTAGSGERTAAIRVAADGEKFSTGVEKATITSSSSDLAKGSFTVDAATYHKGADIWVYSKNSGFNISGIEVTTSKPKLTLSNSGQATSYVYSGSGEDSQNYVITYSGDTNLTANDLSKFKITTSNEAVIKTSDAHVTLDTDNQTFSITGLEVRQAGTATLTFKFEGNDTYAESSLSVPFTVTGKLPFSVSLEDLNIQQRQRRTIMPTITNASGNPIGFDANGNVVEMAADDDPVDYDTYFNFTYSLGSNDIGVTLDGNVLRAGNEVGGPVIVTVTATVKPEYAGKFTNSTASGTLNATVTERTTGMYFDFYLDKKCTQKVADVYSTDIEGSTTVVEDFPNGRVLYLKVNEAGIAQNVKEIWFSTGKNKTPVAVSRYVRDGEARTIYKDDPSKSQYLYKMDGGALPIYIDKDIESGDYVFVNVQCYKEVAGSYEQAGSVIPVKFNIVSHNRPGDVTYDPTSDGSTIRNTAQTVVANGNEGNTVYAKFSSTGTKYTIEGLINEPHVFEGITKTGVFSTEVAGRKISGVQVHNDTDGPFIGKMTSASYVYRFATTLNVTPRTQTVQKSQSATQPEVTATYYDKVQKKDINETASGTITYTVVSNSTDGGTGTATEVAADGTITVGTEPGTVVVKVSYSNSKSITVNNRSSIMDNAETYYTIYVTDPDAYLPTITPDSKKFYPTLTATITANAARQAYYTTDGSDPTSSSTRTELAAGASDYYICNESGTMSAGEHITIQAVSYNSETKQYGKVISETYTLGTEVLPPYFVPSGNGTVPDYGDYTYYTETLPVEARVNTAGASIYYTVDGSEPEIGGATTLLYDGLRGLTITGTGTTTIKAFAYKEEIQSQTVTATYTYSNMAAPYFDVNYSGNYTSGEHAVSTTDPITIGSSVMPSTGTTLKHYFTLDGTDPAEDGGTLYTQEFNVIKTVTAKAYSVLVDANGNEVQQSAVTTVIFKVSSAHNVWEAVEETTPGGFMKDYEENAPYDNTTKTGKDPYGGFVISTKADLSVTNTGTRVNARSVTGYAQEDITVTFGGYDRKNWFDEPISDAGIGSPIDGVGTYSIKVDGENAQMEVKVEDLPGVKNPHNYNHVYSYKNHAHGETGGTPTASQKTFRVPSYGGYVRFEPEKDGELTIWALQNGSLNFNEGTTLCDKFIRFRPVYFVDEHGNSLKAKEAISSARLSSEWAKIETTAAANSWTEYGESQTIMHRGDTTSVKNSGMSKAESAAIYQLYKKYLTDNKINIGDPINPFPIHTGNAISQNNGAYVDDSNDGTGYVMLTAGYVRYKFNVKAGKTYYFFAVASKIGIRGFQFIANEPDATKTLVINENATGTTNSTAITEAKNSGETKKVTYNDRTFAANKWVGVVLPFSMSATQVEKTFGVGTSIVHFNRVEGRKLYLTKHSHQMIVAGTPVIIKPTKENATISDLYAQVEAEKVDVMTDGSYTFTGSYDKGIVKQYDYYFGTSGNLIQRKSSENMELKPARAWLSSPSGPVGAKALEIAFDAFFDGETTGIELVIDGVSETSYDSDDACVYGVNGQIIRKNSTSLEGLPKGIYIVNGKKYVVK